MIYPPLFQCACTEEDATRASLCNATRARGDEEMRRDETGEHGRRLACAAKRRASILQVRREWHERVHARLTHDNLGLGDARRDALVRQDRRAVDVQLVFDRDVVTEDGDVLQTRLAGSAPFARQHGTLTHRPTLLFHPTIELATHAWSRTVAFERMTARCRRTPGPILAPGPMTTLGPMTAVGSISAVCH